MRKYDDEDQGVIIDDAEVLDITDRAIHFDTEYGQYWIPKSAILDIDNDIEVGDIVDFELATWKAKSLGIYEDE